MGELISVIIPSYNSAEFLGECIDSVLGQTWKDVEIILADDGSEDDSVRIGLEYAKSSDRVRVYPLSHRGVSYARNRAIEQARGEYLFFLDADDSIDSSLLEELLHSMRRHGAALGISPVRKFGNKVCRNVPLNRENYLEYVPGTEAVKAFCHNSISGIGAIGGKMMRRELLGESRFDEKLTSGEDTLLLYQLMRKKPNLATIHHAFYNYRIHSRNTIGSITEKKVEDILSVYRTISCMEAADGHEEESYIWYSHMVRWLGKWLETGERLQKTQFRCLKRRIRELKKDKRYRRLGFLQRLEILLCILPLKPYQLIVRKAPECYGCGACADVCPKHCIRMKQGKDGFYYPKTDQKHCNHCGACQRVCPVHQTGSLGKQPAFYGLQAGDEIRAESTSGGAFRLLAEQVLDRQGAVFGAALEAGEVRHIVAEGKEQLRSLLGSKYVQSSTAGVFAEVKRRLELSQQVLFSGTPCQVDGLRLYLGKEYDNLLLVDLICNGVASPGAWEKYCSLLEKRHRDRLLEFHFRDKRNKDDGHTVSAVFSGGEKTWSIYKDEFCRTYFRGSNLRTQCRECRYCTDRRNSDLTIGDFWGIDRRLPEWNDGMGNSIVLVHTAKGAAALKECGGRANIEEVEEMDARQPRLLAPVTPSHLKIAHFCYVWMPFALWLKLFGRN